MHDIRFNLSNELFMHKKLIVIDAQLGRKCMNNWLDKLNRARMCSVHKCNTEEFFSFFLSSLSLFLSPLFFIYYKGISKSCL